VFSVLIFSFDQGSKISAAAGFLATHPDQPIVILFSVIGGGATLADFYGVITAANRLRPHQGIVLVPTRIATTGSGTIQTFQRDGMEMVPAS